MNRHLKLLFFIFVSGVFLFTGCKSEVDLPAENQIKSIFISKKPAKLVYVVGEVFDPTGMVVKIRYVNGKTEEITDYTISGFDSSEEVDSELITVTYLKNNISYTTTFKINIIGVSELNLVRAPDKKNYSTGDSFEPAGLVLEAVYTDGTTGTVTNYTTDFDKVVAEPGTEKKVTITYGGKTVTFPINVSNSGSSEVTNRFFWGYWTRMDNGSRVYVTESKVNQNGTNYSISSNSQGKLETGLGTFIKESDNVITLGNVKLFRSSAKDVPYKLTLVGFQNGASIADTLGEGYSVTVTCPEFPSYSETQFSDANGMVTLHSPLSRIVNNVTVTAKDGTKLTASLTPRNAGENLGSLPVSEKKNYALKVTGTVKNSDYLYASQNYNLELSVENISNVVANYSLVELSCSDSNLSISKENFNIASIGNGMKKTVELEVAYRNTFRAPYVDTVIAVKFTDAITLNSWTDYVPLRFYGEKDININAWNTEDNTNTSLNGFIMYPDGSGQQFRINHGVTKSIKIPLFPSPYKLVFGGAVMGETLSESTEMKYSIGVGTSADSVRGVFSLAEMRFAESNDIEESAYEIGTSEKIKAYLGAGDFDYYTLEIYSEKAQYSVRHLWEQADGSYKLFESENLQGYWGGYTNAEPKTYNGYKAERVEQKQILDFNSTVVEIRYKAILTELSLTSEPNKLNYHIGDSFDSNGMVVTAYYGDGSISRNVYDWETNGDAVVTTSGASKSVTVTYTEAGVTKTATFEISVGHIDDEILIKAPTCTENGLKNCKCTICGDTRTEVVSATGHKFATDWTKDGTYHWHAATCGHDVADSKAAHTFGEYVSNNDATTEADGTKTRECSVCRYKDTVTDEGSKIGFVFVKGTTITGTESWTPSSSVFINGRSLTIQDLIVSDHEVTRSEFKKIMGTDPSSASAYDKNGNKLTGVAVLNNPVTDVNWYDAIAYCNKLSIAEGLTPCYSVSGVTDWTNLAYSSIPSNTNWDEATCNFEADGYRLPTEAEWEWLARGGENYTYAGSNTVGDVAWYTSNTNDTGTREVKTKSPNGYGLYDMSGNVWEWCWDWYGSISSSSASDGASAGSNRVERGGGWSFNSGHCAVSYRSFSSPCLRDGGLGFRVVRPSSK